ncbi:uncharacterized protein LOC110432667 [Sorghum bicolor]|uniref:uncharacterized protein LOC110432667 n=1 Tax=Sorghum bicolor TaxID=4558 RepID=UPI000B424DA4|nr:uncharacterized protein LOC110432667 [Sorghum bicolor]|eukprot:XP_021309122.1 uncharacterized protein LOC110432667 [Sorghum bicolor]
MDMTYTLFTSQAQRPPSSKVLRSRTPHWSRGNRPYGWHQGLRPRHTRFDPLRFTTSTGALPSATNVASFQSGHRPAVASVIPIGRRPLSSKGLNPPDSLQSQHASLRLYVSQLRYVRRPIEKQNKSRGPEGNNNLLKCGQLCMNELHMPFGRNISLL